MYIYIYLDLYMYIYIHFCINIYVHNDDIYIYIYIMQNWLFSFLFTHVLPWLPFHLFTKLFFLKCPFHMYIFMVGLFKSSLICFAFKINPFHTLPFQNCFFTDVLLTDVLLTDVSCQMCPFQSVAFHICIWISFLLQMSPLSLSRIVHFICSIFSFPWCNWSFLILLSR